MTLPEEECAFFFCAMGQLEPELQPVFVERVAATLGGRLSPLRDRTGRRRSCDSLGAGRLVGAAA
jgi:hypothetical protein